MFPNCYNFQYLLCCKYFFYFLHIFIVNSLLLLKVVSNNTLYLYPMISLCTLKNLFSKLQASIFKDDTSLQLLLSLNCSFTEFQVFISFLIDSLACWSCLLLRQVFIKKLLFPIEKFNLKRFCRLLLGESVSVLLVVSLLVDGSSSVTISGYLFERIILILRVIQR